MNEKCVVLYIRLSKSDDDMGEKGESNSVTNQRAMLHRFLDNHSTLSHFPRYEAVDDGFTGTNDNRPKLKEILSMAENGEVQAICVKDNSRIFRNYVKMGEYQDIKFPEWGVRFISVNDGYDSEDYGYMTSDMEQALKNIMHASYPKIISQNVISAKVNLMEQGKFVGGVAPYGYRLATSEKSKFIIDKEAAMIVRLIFDMAIEGKNTSTIAYQLNLKNVNTPSQYYMKNFPHSNRYKGTYDKMQWNSRMIYSILMKQAYKGTMVSHERKSAGIGSKKTIKNEPIIVENTHQGIVTVEEFYEAQKVIKRITKNVDKKQGVYPLKGYVRCGNCKRVMLRSVNSNPIAFYCNHGKGAVNSGCTKDLRVIEGQLEEIVLKKILELPCRGIEIPMKPNIRQRNSRSASTLADNIKQLKKRKLQAYEKYTQGGWSREDFLEKKGQLDEDMKHLELLMFETEVEREQEIPNEKEVSKTERQLTVEMVKTHVKAIYIKSLDNIEIVILE